MKETNNINRICWLNIRLNKVEQEQILKQFNRTTEKKLGTYARNVLLGNPLIAGYKTFLWMRK